MSLFTAKENKEKKAPATKAKKETFITPKTAATASGAAGHEQLVHVLKHSWISERAHDMQGMHKYAFSVDPKATKPMIREAVEGRYQVTVRAVHIVRTPGKLKYYRNLPNRRTARKKAIVTLKEGDVIDTQ